jgi:hypothetical protein
MRPTAFSLLAVAGSLISFAAAAAPDLDADLAALTAAKAAAKDHLAGDDAGARKKLARALAACGDTKCSPSVAARLHRDLGIFLLVQGEAGNDGAAELERALKLDPTIEMDDTFATPAVWKRWVEIVRGKGAPRQAPEEPTEPPKERAPAPAKAPPAPPSTSGFWVGAGVQADIAFLGGADLCGRESQSAVAYSCFRPDNEQYLGVPEPTGPAGLAPSYGTTRVALQIERVLPYHLSVGGRVGFAFGGGPTPAKGPTFVPLHLEASLSYWFGQPLSRDTGLRGFASLLGGMAQMDASRTVTVDECRAGSPSGCTPATNVQPGGDNPAHQTLDAYKKAGQGFIGLGLGAFYSFLPGSGLLVEVRVLQFFPSAATTLSPSIGYVFQIL